MMSIYYTASGRFTWPGRRPSLVSPPRGITAMAARIKATAIAHDEGGFFFLVAHGSRPKVTIDPALIVEILVLILVVARVGLIIERIGSSGRGRLDALRRRRARGRPRSRDEV